MQVARAFLAQGHVQHIQASLASIRQDAVGHSSGYSASDIGSVVPSGACQAEDLQVVVAGTFEDLCRDILDNI